MSVGDVSSALLGAMGYWNMFILTLKLDRLKGLHRVMVPGIIYIYIYIYNVKVKWSHYRSGVAQRVGRDISLLFHDRVTRKAEWSTTRHGRTLPSGKTLLPFTHYVCFFCLLTAVHFYQNCCVVFLQASIGVRQKYRNVLKYTQNKEAQNEASCEGLGLASMLRTCKETSNEPLTFRKNLIK